MPRQIPEWQQEILAGMQRLEDAKYRDAVDAYNSAAKSWIDENVRSREIGVSLTSFSKPIPSRTVYGVDDNGDYTSTSVTDPNIHPPVLPPPVATLPPVTLKTDAPVRDAAVQAMLAQLLVDMRAVRAKLGI